MMLKLNTNWNVRVKPTAAGLAQIEARRAELRKWAPDKPWDQMWELDGEGYLNDQLHAVLDLLGGGHKQLIETVFFMEVAAQMPRLVGYYWIRVAEGREWDIAYWNGQLWIPTHTTGTTYRDQDLAAIDERRLEHVGLEP